MHAHRESCWCDSCDSWWWERMHKAIHRCTPPHPHPHPPAHTGIKHMVEQPTDDGLFSLDVAIQGTNICLEVDGPLHYTAHAPYQELRPFVMRRAMLEVCVCGCMGVWAYGCVMCGCGWSLVDVLGGCWLCTICVYGVKRISTQHCDIQNPFPPSPKHSPHKTHTHTVEGLAGVDGALFRVAGYCTRAPCVCHGHAEQGACLSCGAAWRLGVNLILVLAQYVKQHNPAVFFPRHTLERPAATITIEQFHCCFWSQYLYI